MATTEAQVLQRYLPDYPEGPLRDRIEGTVVLMLSIDARGVVTEATVAKGVHPDLDEAARQALLSHRFEPAMRGDEAIAVTQFPYAFTWALE